MADWGWHRVFVRQRALSNLPSDSCIWIDYQTYNNDSDIEQHVNLTHFVLVSRASSPDYHASCGIHQCSRFLSHRGNFEVHGESDLARRGAATAKVRPESVPAGLLSLAMVPTYLPSYRSDLGNELPACVLSASQLVCARMMVLVTAPYHTRPGCHQ